MKMLIAGQLAAAMARSDLLTDSVIGGAKGGPGESFGLKPSYDSIDPSPSLTRLSTSTDLDISALDAFHDGHKLSDSFQELDASEGLPASELPVLIDAELPTAFQRKRSTYVQPRSRGGMEASAHPRSRSPSKSRGGGSRSRGYSRSQAHSASRHGSRSRSGTRSVSRSQAPKRRSEVGKTVSEFFASEPVKAAAAVIVAGATTAGIAKGVDYLAERHGINL